MSKPTHVVIKCAGGDLVPLPLEIAQQSRLVKNMIDVLKVQENNVEIPCETLKKEVVELLAVSSVPLCPPLPQSWMESHKEDGADADEGKKFNPQLSEQERRWFAELDEQRLYDVMMAANFLDVPHLLDKACETVAAMVRGRTPEEIREILGLKNDFSQEEYELVLKENAWLGD